MRSTDLACAHAPVCGALALRPDSAGRLASRSPAADIPSHRRQSPPSPLTVHGHLLTLKPPLRRIVRTLTLVLALSAFVAALAGAPQTFAQTRKQACPSAQAKHRSKACTTTHRGKAQRQAKRRRKHARTKARTKDRSRAVVAARCADGSVPVLGEEGFVCDDGSTPECENGATPMPSRNGKSLVCPLSGESEAGAGEEAECEEQEAEEELACQEAGSCHAADASRECEATS